ncbi:MAG: TRIC cation channel family protein [Trueperaceae bacterium]
MLQVLIWLGTITFAASGALTATQQRFDIIGVLCFGTCLSNSCGWWGC